MGAELRSWRYWTDLPSEGPEEWAIPLPNPAARDIGIARVTLWLRYLVVGRTQHAPWEVRCSLTRNNVELDAICYAAAILARHYTLDEFGNGPTGLEGAIVRREYNYAPDWIKLDRDDSLYLSGNRVPDPAIQLRSGFLIWYYKLDGDGRVRDTW